MYSGTELKQSCVPTGVTVRKGVSFVHAKQSECNENVCVTNGKRLFINLVINGIQTIPLPKHTFCID